MAMRVAIGFAALVAVVLGTAVLMRGGGNAEPCLGDENTGAEAGYSVMLCVAVGDEDILVLQGDVPVAVSVEASNQGRVQRVNAYLNDEPLIEDVTSPYEFELPTSKFADGEYVLEVEALLRDGFQTKRLRVDLDFKNGQADVASNTLAFSPPTASLGDGPLVLAVTGDGAGGRPESQRVVDLVNSWTPDVFGYLGDVYENGSITEFHNWYGHDGSFFDSLRSVTAPVLGNHEYEGGASSGYIDYWGDIPKYYSFDAGGWHFIVIDSNRPSLYDAAEATHETEQFRWLRDDLAANDAVCTVALFHHPVFSIGTHGWRDLLNPSWELLVDSGVDLVLTGHDHQYQRWEPFGRDRTPDAEGLTQFVIGTGGHGVRKLVDDDPSVVARADDPADSVGALRLELNVAGAAYSFVNIDGVERDSGTVACRGAGPDNEPPDVPGDLVAEPESHVKVKLSWTRARDNVGVVSYTVQRDGEELGEATDASPEFVDTTAEPNTAYTYEVRAIDPDGNESQAARTTVTTPEVPDVLVLDAEADLYVSSENPTNTYWSAESLRVDATPEVTTYLRFDVVGLREKPPAVVLRVPANSNSTGGFNVHLGEPDEWNERDVSFSSAPEYDPTPVGASGPTTEGGWVEIDVSGSLELDGTYTFVLTGASDTGVRLGSIEGGAPAQLIIKTRG